MTENRSARPPATGGGAGSRLNWATAMSAVAAAIAAVVAVIAYLAPPTPPPPVHPDTVVQPPSPDQVTTRPEPPTPTPSPEPSTPEQPKTESEREPESQPETEPTRTRRTRDSPPPLAKVRSPGCDETMTAVAGYRRNAGGTRGSQAAAAQQTYRDLMGAGLDAQGAVGAMIRRLTAEFQELSFRLSGMVGSDPNQVIADINADFAELKRLCEAT